MFEAVEEMREVMDRLHNLLKQMYSKSYRRRCSTKSVTMQMGFKMRRNWHRRDVNHKLLQYVVELPRGLTAQLVDC